jgi:hypothetical protein
MTRPPILLASINRPGRKRDPGVDGFGGLLGVFEMPFKKYHPLSRPQEGPRALES